LEEGIVCGGLKECRSGPSHPEEGADEEKSEIGRGGGTNRAVGDPGEGAMGEVAEEEELREPIDEGKSHYVSGALKVDSELGEAEHPKNEEKEGKKATILPEERRSYPVPLFNPEVPLFFGEALPCDIFLFSIVHVPFGKRRRPDH
jgi:hypothetical protein